MTDPAPVPSTSLARQFVRHLVGFGVGVAVGLAPFLGTLDVPLFAPLLSMFPISLRGTAVPVSSFLMGLVAIGVQFAAGESIARGRLRKWFVRTFVVILGGLIVLVTLYSELVVRVGGVARIDGEGTTTVAVVTGFSRRADCECPPRLTDAQCVRELGLDNAAACWGDAQVRRSGLALVLAYLVLTSGFGALVGLLLLQERARRRATPRPRPPSPGPGRRRGRPPSG